MDIQIATPSQQTKRKTLRMGESDGGIVRARMFHDSAGMESRKPMQRRILGIEGGGTKTEWVLLDEEERVLGEGRLHAANLKLCSDPDIAELFAALPREVSHVGAFLAGCALDSDRARLGALAAAAWPGAFVRVGNDCESGFATALGEGDGIIVISGTGSVVHGRCGGRMDKAGGWGHILGDRGGGYDIARFALRQMIRRYDLDRSRTELASAILAELGLDDLPHLDDWVIHADKMKIAALAPVVFRIAESDGEFRAFIERRARELADFTLAVAGRLGMDRGRVEVRLLGGLLTHVGFYAAMYTAFLRERLPLANVEPCTRSGAYGAAMIAQGQPR